MVEKLGDDWVKPGNMVTNGAFTLTGWQPQGFVRVEKNPHFRDAPNVALDAVTYFPTADRNAAYNRYRSSELDIIGDFPPGEIIWLRREMPRHIHIAPLLSIMYLVFNVSEAPFDDTRVRRALTLAIDRELITGRVLESGEVPSVSFVPPLVADYASAVAPRPVDRNAARALLAEAGYDDANPLNVLGDRLRDALDMHPPVSNKTG